MGSSFADAVVNGSLLVALPVAALAGFLSFASPCVLPLLPGYVGYLSGMAGQANAGSDAAAAPDAAETRRSTGSLLAGLLAFVAGFSLVFVALGVVFASLGYALAPYLRVITAVLGVVVILMGLSFAGWLPGGASGWTLRLNPRGKAGGFLLGLTFGLGWTPCIGPTLAAVLTLALTDAHPLRGALLAAAYCLGLGVPFVVFGLLFHRSTTALAALRRHRLALMRAGGILLIIVGALLVTGWWAPLTAWIQQFGDSAVVI